MELDIAIEALLAGDSRRPTKVNRVPRHERIIAGYHNGHQVQILRAGQTTEHDACRLRMAAIDRAMDKIATETFVEEELHATGCRRFTVRRDKTFTSAGPRRSGGRPYNGLARA